MNLFSFTRSQNYSSRQKFVVYVVIIVFIGFGYRVFTIKDISSFDVSVKQKALNQSTKTSTRFARRGDILDRHGQILASNLVLKKVNLDPTLVQAEFIPKLAKTLNIPYKELESILAKKKKLGRKHLIIRKNLIPLNPMISNIKQLKKIKLKVCVQKNSKIKFNLFSKTLITLGLKQNKYQKTKQCRRQKIAGVALQNSNQRYYPKSASLAPLLGRVNRNYQGVSGIEGEFEQVLAGKNGKIQLSYPKNIKGSYFNPTVVSPVKHGQNIELTIDSTIQFYAYSALENAVKVHQADAGAAIILASNGEILAMANYPAENPNNRAIYNPQNYRNRVLSDKIEPGSTMKPFTMLLALDKNKITAKNDEQIDVTKPIGHIKPDNKYQKMTVKQILQKSHNLGTVNIAERLNKKQMYQAWNQLGFGQPLGLIPTIENSGSLRHFSSWNESDKRALAYGYGPMNANLAQLAKAYLVFANQGAVSDLKLIKNIASNQQKTQVFSTKSSAKIADLLGSVVSLKGSGYRAIIKGYDIAGKTGTAEILVNGIYDKKGKKRTFFVGFVPTKNPKYIMAVRLDKPKKCYAQWNVSIRIECEGSNSAAIVFKQTMENILANDLAIIRQKL